MTPTPSLSSPLNPVALVDEYRSAIEAHSEHHNAGTFQTLKYAEEKMLRALRSPTTQQGADPGQPAADRFIHGFAYALANLVRLHGDATEARDLWKESGYKRKDFETAGVDEYDMETLRGLEWLK